MGRWLSLFHEMYLNGLSSAKFKDFLMQIFTRRNYFIIVVHSVTKNQNWKLLPQFFNCFIKFGWDMEFIRWKIWPNFYAQGSNQKYKPFWIVKKSMLFEFLRATIEMWIFFLSRFRQHYYAKNKIFVGYSLQIIYFQNWSMSE